MLLLRFYHNENTLEVGEKAYKATCLVRNELNGWRGSDEIVKTWPLNRIRSPYYPRKFPTGLWEVKRPEWTDNPEYYPVKIPTNAVRKVLTWSTENGKYEAVKGTQDDSFYHLHYASNSSTTLGCIRLDSAEDAVEIANTVIDSLNKSEDVWLEVLASK
jgi:hypothetical protein